MVYPKLIESCMEKLMKLPGIGRRSAERIVFYLLNSSPESVRELTQDMTKLKETMRFCRRCNNLCEGDTCLVCQDVSRERQVLCVVENPKDVLAIERTGVFKGAYHVLLGAISPTEGRGPDDLKIGHLIRRIKEENILEVVIATDADTEGETTALFILRELKPTGVKVSRIGVGIPVGSALEYADMSTLSMSLESRRVMDR